jgi:hypothetical protein
VALPAGLRWGEIVALEWTDVDFDAGKINLRRATPAGTTGPQDPKSLTSQRSIDLLWPVRQTHGASPFFYVSQQLGHSSAGFTLSTYTHLIQQNRNLDKDGTLQRLFTAALRDKAALLGEPVVARRRQPAAGARAPGVPQRGNVHEAREVRVPAEYGVGDRS